MRKGLVLGRVLLEEGEEGRVVHRQDFLQGLPALVEGADVFPHGVPRDVQKVGRGLASLACGVASQDLLDS